jgi:hypothetical protein
VAYELAQRIAADEANGKALKRQTRSYWLQLMFECRSVVVDGVMCMTPEEQNAAMAFTCDDARTVPNQRRHTAPNATGLLEKQQPLSR